MAIGSPVTPPKDKPTPAVQPLRVMVVDDSVVLREIISRMVNEDPSVCQVVATASNGKLAVDRAKQRDLDVIVLDIEMPVMDGITALPELLACDPGLVIIMASTITQRNAEISFKALAAGAKDYVPKPSSLTPGAGTEEFKRELQEKVRTLGRRYRRTFAPVLPAAAPAAGSVAKTAAAPAAKTATRPVSIGRPQVLAIGSSTGGPNALQQLFKGLPPPLKVPVFVTQHMPPTFTGLLAQNLSRDTGHPCTEARDGELVVPGRIYIAPGDFHMTVVREGTNTVIRLAKTEKENYCRPAVDPMLRSLAAIYPKPILVGILTGMGQDGLKGAEVVVKAGGNIVAQDEASSVVWGMPGAVAKAGLCCSVVPLPKMAAELTALLGR